MELLEGALAAGLVLLIVDGLWLGVIARKWTEQQLGHLMRKPILFAPAGIFYALYAFGLSFFAVQPARAAGGDAMMALGLGAFLGLIAYGTYEFTNMSTLKGWPKAFMVVDLMWGTFVSGISAAGGVLLLNQL